ncbi:amino acid ABC transporter substrate-binding protein [Salegentibacter chungangensis]|uniref:LysM peptidoglycan-binding domain-containing protein n=1 Tax=Salegentibacter chungangensis TaxID=1335724 RepID=A0ABW3NSK7_9FLAO
MKYLFILCFFFQIYSISAVGQEYKYHTVQKGETVYSIAKSYNISEEAIYKYNPDAKEGIEVAAKLVIPVSEVKKQNADVNFRTHKVERKETLYSLSKQYNVDIDDIKRYNKHLYAEELQTGEVVRIPVFAKTPSVVERTSNSKKSNVQDKSTREHIVLPKETKYGIARKYGLTVKELEELNPKVEVLKPGVMLKVGTDVLDDQVILATNDFEFYEVKPKETIFGLTRKFEVDKDSLMALNPALKNGLKSGMVLKVPNKGVGVGNLGETETEKFKSDDSKEADSETEVVEEKINLRNNLTNFKTKEIALMLPYHLDKVEADSLATYKDAILNERVLRISLDFYSGVLMAVERAKEMGISTNLRVFDTKQSTYEVNNIINRNNFSNTDAVIGPLLKNTTEAAAAQLNRQEVPVISPLSNRAMRPMSNLFQSRPTDDILAEAMLNYLSNNVEGKNLIVIADPQAYKIKSTLSGLFPSARFVTPSEGFVSEESIAKTLSKTKKNWVILESDGVGTLTSAISALNRLARENEIRLFTTNKNNSYDNDNVPNEHLAKLNFHYPSVDKEYDPEFSAEFIDRYAEKYGAVPNQYAVRGYDLTLDILLRLATAEDLYESFVKYRGYTEYNENKFHYLPSSGGGFHNDAVYIMRINPDLTLSVVNDFKSSL